MTLKWILLGVALVMLALDCIQSIVGRKNYAEKNPFINWLVSKIGLGGVALYFVVYASIVLGVTLAFRNSTDVWSAIVPCVVIVGESYAVISNFRTGVKL